MDAESPAAGEKSEHRNTPRSAAFRAYIAQSWSPRSGALPAQLPSAPYAAARRERLSAAFPGERLVLPAGGLSVRSNDCDYRFRPHSAFAHLTGLGTDQEPDAVLVLEPVGQAHAAVLYFRPRAERDTEEFYSDATYGELWVGVRPSLAEITALTGLATRHLDELRDSVAKDTGEGGVSVRIIREADAALTAHLDQARAGSAETGPENADGELARAASELRLVKDAYEIEQMRLAVASSVRGFDDIVRALPRAVASDRGERVDRGRLLRPRPGGGQRAGLRHDRRLRPDTRARCTGSATTGRCAPASWC